MLFFSSLQSKDQFAVCSQWSTRFWLDILLPWLFVMGVTILIIKKNGRDLRREIWLPFISRIFPRIKPLMTATPRGVEDEVEMQVCTVIELIGKQPMAKLPTQVRFQVPHFRESEESSDWSVTITETHLTKQSVPINTVNMELQETGYKHDLKKIKEEIKTEQGMAQELQSVTKGKGKGKGKSNFKKGKVLRPKTLLDDKPEGIKQETISKEDAKKLTRSALTSRWALKKWKERAKQLQARKSLEAKRYVFEHDLMNVGLENEPEGNKQDLRCKEEDKASREALKKWKERTQKRIHLGLQ